VALLIEVHAHHQRFAELLRFADEHLPRRVMVQDVADHQLPFRRTCGGDHTFTRRDARRDGFLGEDVAALRKRGEGDLFMSVGIRRDAHRIRLGLGERLLPIVEQRMTAAEFLIDRALALATCDQTDDAETGDAMISLGVRAAHVAATDHQDTDLSGHADSPA
jgi:hypothetical protein